MISNLVYKFKRFYFSNFYSKSRLTDRKLKNLTSISTLVQKTLLHCQLVITYSGDILVLERDMETVICIIQFDSLSLNSAIIGNKFLQTKRTLYNITKVLKSNFYRVEEESTELSFDRDKTQLLVGDAAIAYETSLKKETAGQKSNILFTVENNFLN